MENKNNEDWIYDIIPAEQAAEMEHDAAELQHNLNHGLNVVLSASNDSAIKLCRAFAESKKGDVEAWMYVTGFVASLIGTIEEHLSDEGINPHDN